MSDDYQGTRLRDTNQPPVYMTVDAAAELAGVNHRTITAHIEPDAWRVGRTGKKQPMYRLPTVEQFKTEYRVETAGGAL